MMLLRNIRLDEALMIVRACRLVTTRSLSVLFLYYSISILSAIFDGVSMVMLIDLITGKAGKGSTTPVVETIMSFLERFSIHADFRILYFLLIWLFIMRVTLIFAYTYLDGYFEAILRRRVQEESFTSVIRGDWETLRDMRVGQQVGAITEEASNVAKYLMAVIRSIYSLLAVLVFTVMAFTISLQVSLLFISIGIPVMIILRYLFNWQAKIAEKLVNERQGFYANITERINGLFQIKVEGNIRHHTSEGLKNQKHLTQLEVKWWNLRAYIYSFNALMPVIVLASSYLWAFAKGVELQSILNLLAGVGIVGARALTQVNQLTSYLGNITGFAGSIGPVYSLFSIPAERERKPLPDRIRSVDLERVTYNFSENAGIRNVSLSASIGRPLIIMGPSGSGKTTLANLIAGVYRPVSGSIAYLSDCGQTYNALEFRPKIGYVTQDILLFHGTVRANLISSNDITVGDELLWRCLSRSGAEEFVREIGGLDAVISESGRSLSGGERRRLGISRVLTSEPDILILDEVTVGLDESKKQELIRTIRELSDLFVVIIITHDMDLVGAAGYQKYNTVCSDQDNRSHAPQS
jgi:ABC-type multidrug transport system fused ATPase/permease subunit